MEGTPATPDAALAPEEGTPAPPAATPPTTPPEPAPPPEPEPPADQPAAAESPFRQAEYTQSQQTIAAIRAELGLAKTATRAEVLEAFKNVTARAAKAPEEDDGTTEDPRVAEAEGRAFRAEIRAMAAVYGDDFTVDGINVINLARSSNDAEQLMLALAEFRDKHGPPAASAAPAPAADASPATPPPDAGLPEGDASAPPGPAPAGRRETGVQAAVRGLFRQQAEREGAGTR